MFCHTSMFLKTFISNQKHDYPDPPHSHNLATCNCVLIHKLKDHWFDMILASIMKLAHTTHTGYHKKPTKTQCILPSE